MSSTTSIEWTNSTWNPVTGCIKISVGCKNCYAERLAKRLQCMGNPRYTHGFQVQLHNDLVTLPLQWKKPRLIFINSMSDLFHEQVPLEFIKSVFMTIQSASHHTFQLLTKRAKRLADICDSLPWPENLWVGVSIEDQDNVWRVEYLKRVPAHLRFISCEPLLGNINLSIEGIHWVIVGGESGPHARYMDLDWVRSLRDQCNENHVSFFLKQLGGKKDKRGDNKARIDGKLWKELPILVSRTFYT